MIHCSNCHQSIPAGAAPASITIAPHDYPMCSMRCTVRWARRIDVDAPAFAPPASEPVSRPIAPVVELRPKGRASMSPEAREARRAKIRAFWAAMSPEERARRTSKARRALKKSRAAA